MKTISFLSSALGVALSFGSAVLAQDYATHGTFTEPKTGISFYTSIEANGAISGDGDMSTVSVGGFTFGIALPGNAATVDSYEYIGLIVGSLTNGAGWSGIVQGDNTGAGMPNHLMLLAWPTGVGNTIATSFRYSVSYQAPVDYKGSAKVTPIFSKVNATSFTFVYRCQNCLLFDDPSQPSFNTSTSQGRFEQGWAQSTVSPADKTNSDSPVQQHNNGMGEFQIIVSKAANAAYAKWAGISSTVPTSSASAAPYPTGNSTANSTASVVAPSSTLAAAPSSSVSATPTTFKGVPVPSATSYDYLVVGGGAGGIPIADKLSAAGHSVLLIEKGVASSARWGGTIRPESGWLDGYNLTWFDIPGECNRIWNGGSQGVASTDTDQMAGCILGGGTAVNAGLWWKPNPPDWDYNFPAGCKSTDMAAATGRVFSRIPGTDHPSRDGLLYVQSGWNIVSQGLASANWTAVTANNVPAEKDRTYAHTEYMYRNGERGGPMATYLVTANGRNNFHLWLNTSVERINRIGGHATSVDVIATNDGGHVGTVQLTETTGRVIVAAGAFGTPKLLFRSGIGPSDMLEQVQQSTDGPTFIKSTDWIDLPVGYNLADHLNTDCVISHPNISYYDWPAAWDTPITADKISYLTNRTGPLTQAAPDIGPMMWEVIKGPDGIDRQFQWTSRVEGSNGVPSGNSMTLSLYLGRGAVSRGRTTIGKSLNMVVQTLPYGDPNDLTTVGWAIDNMVNALKTIPNITINLPPPGVSGADYLKTIPLTYANVGARHANHWMGTAKLGTDDGRLEDGTAVVDTNTLIYGTDNIFVVDASIFPGMPSTNPSALIVTASEHASDLILAHPYPKKTTIVKKGGQCSSTGSSTGWFGWWGGVTGVGGSGNSLTCDEGLTCKAVNYFSSVCQ